jgi:hypothetical protein
MATKFNTETPVFNAMPCPSTQHNGNHKILLTATTKTHDKTTTLKIESLIFNTLTLPTTKNLPYATTKIQQKSTIHIKTHHKSRRIW